jgi:hypothetical protein
MVHDALASARIQFAERDESEQDGSTGREERVERFDSGCDRVSRQTDADHSPEIREESNVEDGARDIHGTFFR